MAFQEGDEVQAGQLLFQIDPRPFQAALDQAVANLAKDQAQLVNARQEVTRYRTLVQNDLATQEQFDQFQANADAAQAAVTADSAAVQTARLNLEYTTIKAQIAGRTGSLLLREGNLVPVNGATPLVIVNQIRPIAVSFSVPQQYLDDIQHFSAQRRLDVEIRPAEDTTAVLRGTLSFINNQVDTTTGTIQLKATFANASRRLWPGEFVATRLVLNVERNVLTVPSQRRDDRPERHLRVRGQRRPHGADRERGRGPLGPGLRGDREGAGAGPAGRDGRAAAARAGRAGGDQEHGERRAPASAPGSAP